MSIRICHLMRYPTDSDTREDNDSLSFPCPIVPSHTMRFILIAIYKHFHNRQRVQDKGISKMQPDAKNSNASSDLKAHLSLSIETQMNIPHHATNESKEEATPHHTTAPPRANRRINACHPTTA